MWQKLRLYCACWWGEGEQADQGSTCRPEPGVSALSSEGLNLIHREECEQFATLPTGMNLRRQALPVSMRTSSQVATQKPGAVASVGLADPGRISVGAEKSSFRGLATDQDWQAPLMLSTSPAWKGDLKSSGLHSWLWQSQVLS